MSAYYNEIDPYAAQWLRNLIAAGHIAPGDVDERSIEDVRPDDIRGYAQCHFFAGVGVWSHSLRRAGWGDDRPVWTGSCPCQPFSAAGKGVGFADERHLWPAWHHLIEQCQPERIFGEQVASADGLGWLDLVQADLEGTGYACGAVDLCAAGVGAPHIRQRLWFVANTKVVRRGKEHAHSGGVITGDRSQGIATGSLHGVLLGGLADSDRDGRESGRQGLATMGHGPAAESDRCIGGLADAVVQQRSIAAGSGDVSGGRDEKSAAVAGFRGDRGAGPTNGLWRDADWLLCRDGKWRPVEPGTFPLAHGAASRVGRLRAYGNAINAEAAMTFILAAKDVT